MDRNLYYGDDLTFSDVALRKESVDRNYIIKITETAPRRVALRKESVDRNWVLSDSITPLRGSLSARRAWIEIVTTSDAENRKRSLSARRAWIEITVVTANDWASVVALRKESVDRNIDTQHLSICVIESLSARRAWIEIIMFVNLRVVDGVALRKESVDRNFYYCDKDADWVRSLSARRAWIEMPTLC